MLDLIQSLSSRNGFGAEAENGNAKAQQISDDLQEFDEKLRSHRPDHDKAIIRRSFFISTLRVSWNLIEAEILHNPGNLRANAHTVRNLHFLSKKSTLISPINCRFFWVKNSGKCCGFELFSC